MTNLSIFGLQLAAGGFVTYFLCQRLALWLLPILGSAARESERYGIEVPTKFNLFFLALLLLYVGIAWVSFCVTATFHIAVNADSWLWWLYFIISFIWSWLILTRAVRYLGDPIVAMNVSPGRPAENMEFFGNIIATVLILSSIAAFLVFWIWPGLISIGFGWVEWLISSSMR